MGNSSSHNVHHIHQPSTASSTLQPSMNHNYHQQNYHNQQQQHHQSYPRNNRKPPFTNPGFKVLPERVPGQKLRLTDNGSVLQNGGTISGRKIMGNTEIQPPQPQYHHHHQVHEDADLVRNLRRLSDISDERERQVPSPDMVSLTKRYNSHPDLLNDAPVSRSPVRRSHEMPPQHEETSRLVRKKSPKKGKAPVPPHEDGEVNRSSFMDARRAFANFLKANSPRKGEPHQPGFPSRSPDESDRPRMVVYPNPAHQRNGASSNSNLPHTMEPPLPKACFDEDARFESPARGNHSPKTHSRSSNDHGKRIRSMDSLDVSGDGQASFFLKHGELNKSVDSLQVTEMRNNDPGAGNQREIGRRASAASDSYFRRNNCGPPGRDESRPNGPDKWLFGRLLNSSREAALRHDASNPEQPLEQHSELNWKRGGDHRIQRRESMGNHHNAFPRQQYFYGQGDPKVPIPGDASVGSLDRRQPLDVAKNPGTSSSLLQQKGGSGYRQKDESPRGNFPKKEGTPRQEGSQQQQQLEEFSLREFGRREAALRRPSGEAQDGASSEDEMDINMNLRPTLPKRVPTIPRFSPTQVWRSLSLDDPESIVVMGNHAVNSSAQRRRMSEHSSDDDDNEGDVFEDRIQRVARPVAPPRGSQEKSADSGISRDAGSPLPVVCDFEAVLRNVRPSPPPLLLHSGPHQDDGEKRGTWTPEEDLASDFDGGSGEGSVPVAAAQWPVREMVTSHPKLIPRRDMFAPRVPRPGESFTVDSVERRGNGAVAGKARKAKAAAAAAASSSSNTTASTPEANGNSVGTAQTFNSVRKLKRSLSGVLGNGGYRGKNHTDVTNFDENWSLSRSLPNSLHNGQEGEKVSSGDVQNPRDRDTRQVQNPRQQVSHPPISSSAALAAAIREDPSQQAFRVLPRSESGPIHSGRPSYPEGDHRIGRTESELAGHRRPFTDLEGRSYADERQNARSGSAAASWWYSPRGGHIVYLPEYDAKTLVEQSSDGVPDTQGHDGKVPPMWRKPKKFTYQSTVRQIERRQLDQKLTEEVAQKERLRDREMELVNKVEEEFQRKRDREKANIRQQLRILSMESSDTKEPNGELIPQDDISPQRQRDSMVHGYDDPNLRPRGLEDTGHRSLPVMGFPDEDYDTASHRSTEKPQGNGGGFFSGIGKWMRRQQRLEKHQDRNPYQDRQHQSRLEPEGAPHSGSTDSWENRRGDLMDPRRQHFGYGSPGQRHSIAVDGGCSGDDRWPQHGASASDGGWRTEEYQQHDQNHNRQQRHSRIQQQGKTFDEGFPSKRSGNSDKPSPGIHHRSQSFSQMWDEDAANRQSATSSQIYPRSKSSSRPVPFGANSRGGQS